MDFLNLSKAEILKFNKDKLQKCVLVIKSNTPPGLTIKDLILYSFKEIKADIKQLQNDIEEMKVGVTPVTTQKVSGFVSNNLLKPEKEHYEPQQYSRRNNVEILGLPVIFTGDHLRENYVELCNDVGVRIEVRDCFIKKVTISYPKELLYGLLTDDLPRISYLNKILVQR